MRALHAAAIAAVLTALLVGAAGADRRDDALGLRGRIWCTTTIDPVLLEAADLCGDGKIFTLMLSSGAVIPLRAATPRVLEELDVALEQAANVHGALEPQTGVLVVTAVEPARVIVRQDDVTPRAASSAR
jgi:hypothetical protein